MLLWGFRVGTVCSRAQKSSVRTNGHVKSPFGLSPLLRQTRLTVQVTVLRFIGLGTILKSLHDWSAAHSAAQRRAPILEIWIPQPRLAWLASQTQKLYVANVISHTLTFFYIHNRYHWRQVTVTVACPDSVLCWGKTIMYSLYSREGWKSDLLHCVWNSKLRPGLSFTKVYTSLPPDAIHLIWSYYELCIRSLLQREMLKALILTPADTNR